MYIEKLKYFIDLYQCCSFTETARKNFISQASLSQYIGGLEKEFQVKLFDRTMTPIQPTAAGKLFYEEAVILTKQYENMQGKMKHFQENSLPPLKLAYTSLVDAQALFPVVQRLKETYPDLELQLHKVRIRDVVEYLEKRVCDAAISFATEFAGYGSIRTKTLAEGRYVALVGKNHPLFSREEISVAELYQYPLIMLGQNVIGKSYDVMVERTKADGYMPEIRKTVEDIDTELFSIATEGLIGFAPESYELVDFKEHIRKIPIRESNHAYRIQLGYEKNQENPTLKKLLEVLKNMEEERVL